MAAQSPPPLGDVSCRVTGYTVQQLQRMGLPTDHLTRGLAYTLDDLQSHSASIPWDDYLVFLQNSNNYLTADQLVELCTSYKGSSHLRPLLSATGLWFQPAQYFKSVADPEIGAIRQLFRCVQMRFTQVGDRDVVVEEVIEPGFALPPDIFWETQAIAFGALTTTFGLSPSIVTWEPIERGAAFRVRLPRRRPVRFALSWLASWFRRDTAEDVRSALSFGYERNLRLECEIAERKQTQEALSVSEERFRRITDAVPGIVYQYYLDPEGRQGFDFVSGGAMDLTGYTPDELIARPGLIWERIDPDDIPGVQHAILESARNGTHWQHEFRFRTRAGDSRWVRGRSVPEPATAAGRIKWNGILTDVTAERQADADLRARDALLQKLSEQVPGFIYQYQQWPDGRSSFPYASEGIRVIYEVTPEEVRVSAEAVVGRLHPDDLEAVAESILRSVETLEPWRCEYRVRLPERGIRWLDGHAVPERLTDGSTIWHGYIRDVTDRKQTEDLVRESENRFRTLIEDLQVGVVLITPDDRIVLSNPAACQILGLTHDQLHGVAAKDSRWEIVREDGTLFSPEDIPFSVVARTLQPLLNVTVGSRNQDTGHRTWMQVNGTPRLNPDGSLLHVILTFVDITELKRAERLLRESEERFRAYIDHAPSGLFVLDENGQYVDANPAACRISGYDREELLRMGVGDLTTAEAADGSRATFGRIKDEGAIEADWPLRRKSGEVRLVSVAAVRLSGNRYMGYVTDITERHQAETKLRESEERLRFALAAGRMGTFDWDLKTDRIVWSDTHYDLFGYPPGDRFPVEFRHFAERLHPDDRPAIERTIREAKETHSAYTNESRIVLPDGTVRWVLGSGEFRYAPDGRPVRMLGTAIDITERKRAEAALRESELRLSAVIDHAPNVAIQWYDSDGRVRLWNQASELMFGFPAAEVIGRTLDQLIHTPEEFAVFRDTLAEIARTGHPTDPGEYTFRRRDGSAGVCLSTLFGIPGDPNGDWFVCMDVDITERKRADEALRASELRYRTLIETSSDGIFLLDLTGRILSANPAAVRQHGYSMEELLAMRIQDLDLPDDAAVVLDRLQRIRVGDSLTFEVVHRRKDGTTFPVEVVASAVEIGGEWLVLAFDRDITERKRGEEELREREAQLRVALSAAAAVAFVWDAATDSVVRYFSTEPSLPMNLDAPEPVAAVRSKVHPEDRVLFDAGVARCLAEGSEYHNLYRIMRPDGTFRWLEEWGTIARDETALPKRLTGISIDVTERKLVEDQLRSSLFEKEAMLKEIHHRVKNNLQVISSLLSLQAARVTHPAATDVLAESQNRVRAMALVHETLYRSDDLARVDLSRYLGELCGYLFRSYGVDSARVRLELNVEPVTVSLDKTIPCGLLVNEIVSNSLKYAFPGTRSGTVTVGASTRPDGHLTLTLADDGVGLPAEVVVGSVSSLGLKLVSILTEQIGGQLTVERFPGTRFVITFAP
jgi:PAS domain S-box-containing protein